MKLIHQSVGRHRQVQFLSLRRLYAVTCHHQRQREIGKPRTVDIAGKVAPAQRSSGLFMIGNAKSDEAALNKGMQGYEDMVVNALPPRQHRFVGLGLVTGLVERYGGQARHQSALFRRCL